MTIQEFNCLSPGDTVSHVSDLSHQYIVTAHYGTRVTAVMSVDITNSPEWKLITKVTQRKIVGH